MENISIRIPKHLKEEMSRTNLDWEDYLTRAIQEKLKTETRRALAIRAIKRPHRIPSYIGGQLKLFLDLHVRRRAPFTSEEVASGWGMGEVELPHFSARLYREVKLLEEAIRSYHAKRSLEIGCGYGRLTPWIAEHSHEHYAIEPEKHFLDYCDRLYPNTRFFQAKAQKLPFPDAHFDLLVSWTVLQHVPPGELAKVVREMKRVCAPEATMILAEGVGTRKEAYYWERTLDEWRQLLSPWQLASSAERKIEETFKGNPGLVMRFENGVKND